MKNLYKGLALILILAMAMAAVGCGAQGGVSPTPATTPDVQSTPETPVESPEAPAEAPRVALILEGAISDMSWNATAYNGLKQIEELGAQIRYVENVAASAVTDAIRTFAEEGYNVIFLATSSYADAGSAAAADYPDVQFFMINSAVVMDNVASFAIQDAQQGFLMGALAALLTKTGTVAFVGGLEIQPILNGEKGFAQGVAYVNPDVKVLSQKTGSMDDVNAAKNLAKTMIGQGADVVAPMANQASLGVMEAAQDEGTLAIGSGLNQETVALNAAVVAIVKDTAIAYRAAYQSYLDGTIPNEVIKMGAAQGVVYIGEYYIEVPEEVKTQLMEIYQKLAAGEITIDLS